MLTKSQTPLGARLWSTLFRQARSFQALHMMFVNNTLKGLIYLLQNNLWNSNVNNQRYDKNDYENTTAFLVDYGAKPFAFNIEKITEQNNAYRIALWTGTHLQLTLMSINVGEDIGLEVHPHTDQFIRIEEGQGVIKMGDSKDKLDFQAHVCEDYAFIIPAGKWHNLINTGKRPIKLYSIYAPPQHLHGTVHATREIAAADEPHH